MDAMLPPELEQLVRTAIARDASDLFIVPDEPPAVRLHGAIERLDAPGVPAEETERLALAVFGGVQVGRLGLQTGVLKRWCGLPGEYNASVAVSRSAAGYALALRIMLPRVLSVREVLLPDAMVEAGLSRHGLIIFSGRIGSGKTTALYSLLDHINAHAPCRICTVTDSDYMWLTAKKALVQQFEVGRDVPGTLSGIRAAVSQDSDVLFVGELAGVEELQACITAAELGSLVITQLHAPTPEGAIQRIVDTFPEEMRRVSLGAFARVLRAVSAQCLLPRASRKGRVAAYGVLIPDDEMRAAIAAGRDLMARKTPWPTGCQTIAEHVRRLASEGVISEETAAVALAAPA